MIRKDNGLQSKDATGFAYMQIGECETVDPRTWEGQREAARAGSSGWTQI